MMDIPSGSPEPSILELRYRRLLRVLPGPYREVREQEMVDTFLDSEFGADPDNADLTAKFGGVGWRETTSILALALHLRWADPLGPERYRTRLAALQIALVAVLTMLAAWAVLSLSDLLWNALWPPDADRSAPGQPVPRPLRPWWPLLERWAFVLWVPALVLVIRSRRATIWWAAALSAVPAMTTVISIAADPFLVANSARAVVQVAVPVGLAVLATASAVPRIRYLRGWLTAAGTVLVAVIGVALLAAVGARDGRPPTWMLPIGRVVVDDVGGWIIAVVVVAGVLAVRSFRGGRIPTVSLLGLAWFGLAATVLRAATMDPWLTFGRSGYPGAWTTLVCILTQLALAAAITVTAGTVAALRIRRMPAVRYAPAGPSGPTLTA